MFAPHHEGGARRQLKLLDAPPTSKSRDRCADTFQGFQLSNPQLHMVHGEIYFLASELRRT
jgi:hypothetical protein